MIVIDASVAIKIINPEDTSDLARDLLDLHLKKTAEIIVPTLLFIEVANALATKPSISAQEIKKGLGFLYNASFLLYELTETDLLEAATLAKQYKTSVYDMIYAVIAKKKKIKLITADGRFVKKVGFPFVQTLT